MGGIWGCGLLVLLLGGCNGLPRTLSEGDNFQGRITISSGFPLPYFFQGSAVQWTQDYAVTVRHIPFLSDVAYTCSMGCDMVFIRHKAEAGVPVWREAVRGESVTAVGFGPLMAPMKGEGKAMAIRIRLDKPGDPTAYAAHDGPIVQGMSGGPVYGKDGAVVGMTVGMLFGGVPQFGELRGHERISLYLPYDVVLREWEVFSRRL